MGTINFVLVGGRNTGKTCYLSVLAAHCPCITVSSDDAIDYLKVQGKALDTGTLPQATASTIRELHFQYSGGSHKVDFSIDDYDGSFIESLSRSETEYDESRNALKVQMQESEGFLFFMPYEAQFNDQALLDFENEVNTVITLMEDVTSGNYRALPIPVVICVTKWDRSPDYKKGNDSELAAQYLKSIPCYQRTSAKLKQLFAHVTIQPISSFGQTEDGIHPIKGNLQPYQINKPILFCLDKAFQRFEQKINDYQANNETNVLFEYLYNLYDDFKHYQDGQYCRLYDELEATLSQEILQCIRADKQTELTPEQNEIVAHIRQEPIYSTIEEALQKNKGNRLFKRFIAFASTIIVACGVFYYMQHTAEQEAYMQLKVLIADETKPMAEAMQEVTRFNQTWTFPKPLEDWFKSDRNALVDMTNTMVYDRLKALLDISKQEGALREETLNQLENLRIEASDWIDEDERKTMERQIQMVLDSDQESKAFAKLTTMIAKNDRPLVEIMHKVINFHQKWTLPSPFSTWFAEDRNELREATNVQIRKLIAFHLNEIKTADLPNAETIKSLEEIHSLMPTWVDGDLKLTVDSQITPVFESLSVLRDIQAARSNASTLSWSDYTKLQKDVASVLVIWSEMTRLMGDIHLVIVSKIKADAEDAVKTLNVRGLKVSKDRLNILISDGDVEATSILHDKVLPAISVAVRKQKMKKLTRALKTEDKPSLFKEIIQKYWMESFVKKEREHIQELLQAKFEEYEGKSIPNYQNISSKNQMSGIKDKLEKIGEASRLVIRVGEEPVPFSFRYHRPEKINNKIKRWDNRLKIYEQALANGIRGFISFSGDGSSDDLTNPVGFKCGWNNDDLEIIIDGKFTFKDNDSRRACYDDAVSWKTSRVYLKIGRHLIDIVEHDSLGDDKWHGDFQVTDMKIFKFVNEGEVAFKFQTSAYQLHVHKK